MGNSAPTSLQSLASIGRSARPKQRAPYQPPKPSTKSPNTHSPPAPRAPSFTDPKAPHPNPYYELHETKQDPLALPRAYGHNTENINPEMYKALTPLGVVDVDVSKLNIEAEQTKNEEVNQWVNELLGSIQEKAAPNVVAPLEDQIMALQYIGADPRQIAALQDKLALQNALKAKSHAPNANTTSHTPQSGIYVSSENHSPRIVINPQDILSTPSEMLSPLDPISQKSFIKDQMPDIASDPFSESIAAAHASRSPSPHSYSHPSRASKQELPSDEPLFRHDPLQNLPGHQPTAARSVSSNPDIVRNIPGLCTSAQMDAFIIAGTPPQNFPITNPAHLELLQLAIKPPIKSPVKTDAKLYKRNRINSL